MATDWTDRTRTIVANAQREARRMGHDYVGTEHLLLGLVEDGTGVGADVLETLGVTPERVRREIERLVMTGPTAVAPTTPTDKRAELPLTPRARQAIKFAGEEAAFGGQQKLDSEHLLLGLLREGNGLAVVVLSNLGLSLQQVRAEAFKTRFESMKIVERAVRPVRATIIWKRKRREELLAHQTEIYDREQAEANDPLEAVRAAARRFGDPEELAREFDRTVSASERFGYFMERGLTWRAPETVVRYAARVATSTAEILALALCVVFALVVTILGWQPGNWALLRVLVVILFTAPPTVFAMTWLHIKMRDAMWGAFGSARSGRRVAELNLLMGLVGLLFAAGFSALLHEMDGGSATLWPAGLAAAIVMPLISLVIAFKEGPTEIRDSLWALLELRSMDADADAAS